MGDRAKFDIVLGDRVSTSAKRQATALADVAKAFETAGSAARAAGASGVFGGTGRGGGGSRGGAGRDPMLAIARANAAAFRRDIRIGEQQHRARVRADTQRQRLQERESNRGLFGNLFGGSFGVTLSRMSIIGRGLADVAGAAAQVAESFGRITYDAGQAYVSIASFRQNSITGLTTVLGSAQAAQRTFRNALVIANQTPLDPQGVIGMFNQFAVGGFRERELAPLAAAAADISAARGQTASDSLVRVLTQIRGLGRVMRGDITMQGISAGLNSGDIFESIARQMHLGTGATGRRAAERAVSQGRVNDTVAIQAFMDSVRRRYDSGGALGTFARNQSSTLTGAISNARGAMFTLLGSLDLANTPGIRALTNAILAVTGALDMGSRTGKQFRGIIVSFANVIGTNVFGGITPENISAGFKQALPVMRGFVGFFRMVLPLGRSFVAGFLPGLRSGLYPLMRAIGLFDGKNGKGVEVLSGAFRVLGRGVGFVVGVFVTATTGVLAFVGTINGAVLFITSLPTLFIGAAEGIIEGFVNSLGSGRERIVSAIRDTFGGGVVDTAREALGWHSPSTVFREAGAAVAQGFELGVDGGAGRARRAVQNLVGGGIGAGAAAGLGAGAERPRIETVNIIVEGYSGDARAIVREAVAQLAEMFDISALQGATDLVTEEA